MKYAFYAGLVHSREISELTRSFKRWRGIYKALDGLNFERISAWLAFILTVILAIKIYNGTSITELFCIVGVYASALTLLWFAYCIMVEIAIDNTNKYDSKIQALKSEQNTYMLQYKMYALTSVTVQGRNVQKSFNFNV